MKKERERETGRNLVQSTRRLVHSGWIIAERISFHSGQQKAEEEEEDEDVVLSCLCPSVRLSGHWIAANDSAKWK